MHGPIFFLSQDNITIRINRKKIFLRNLPKKYQNELLFVDCRLWINKKPDRCKDYNINRILDKCKN